MTPRDETEARRRRVLLISPVPQLDPPSGDVIYTENLLRYPPASVEYETYDRALAAGRLRELARRDEYLTADGVRRLRAGIRIGRERSINALRQRGILFREPFRYFSVQRGAYDLVHCHVFSAAFPGLDVPLVTSNAIVIEELYRRARGWSETRVRFASHADALLARTLEVQHTSHRMPAASAVVCFTDALRRELRRRRVTKPDRLHVAPCFVGRPPRRRPTTPPRRVGFVAGDFVSKGGPVVLDAFEFVRQQRPQAELLIIGSPPPTDAKTLEERGITWHPRVPRSMLLEQYLPSLDVFAYPTEFDGLPLIVLEVMALGIPVATSDYYAMPEIVGHGIAGSVSSQGDAPALAQALLRLLDPNANARARERCSAWFDSHFAPEVAGEQLRRAYDAAAGLGARAVDANRIRAE